jgi:hypothetical protein
MDLIHLARIRTVAVSGEYDNEIPLENFFNYYLLKRTVRL